MDDQVTGRNLIVGFVVAVLAGVAATFVSNYALNNSRTLRRYFGE